MLDATGTVTALNSVDIRPQVASIITKVHIKEGQFVTAGQLLFTLDARNDEVNVTKAKAQLAKDQAALADAERQLARSKDLFAQNFISQGAVDTNQTLVESQQAVVAADRAAIEAAQVGLSYSRIVAPAAGRAGAINVFAGSFVQPSGAALVTITQLDPIAVAFSLPQRNLGEALATLRDGGGKVTRVVPREPAARRRQAAVRRQHGRCRLGHGAGQGRVREQGRAALARRLRHHPPRGAVAEGRERDPAGGDRSRRRAARSSTSSTPANKASPRPVEILYAEGVDAAVSGVTPGERIVLDGRQNLRPGATVVERAATEGRPRQARRAASAASARASASAAGARRSRRGERRRRRRYADV